MKNNEVCPLFSILHFAFNVFDLEHRTQHQIDKFVLTNEDLQFAG